MRQALKADKSKRWDLFFYPGRHPLSHLVLLPFSLGPVGVGVVAGRGEPPVLPGGEDGGIARVVHRVELQLGLKLCLEVCRAESKTKH